MSSSSGSSGEHDIELVSQNVLFESRPTIPGVDLEQLSKSADGADDSGGSRETPVSSVRVRKSARIHPSLDVPSPKAATPAVTLVDDIPSPNKMGAFSSSKLAVTTIEQPPEPTTKRVPVYIRWKTEPLVGSGTESDAEQRAFTALMFITTLFALWGTDLYELMGPPSLARDPVLYTLVAMALLCFSLELFFYTLFKPGYFLSFFFFLDFIATISLIPDALLLWNIAVFGESTSTTSGMAFAQAAQPAARAGARAARIVRLFKLFSLLKRRKSKEGNSKIGQVLAERTTQKVVIIVALMLISSQMLNIVGSAAVFYQQIPSLRNQLDILEHVSSLDLPNTVLFYTLAANTVQGLNNVSDNIVGEISFNGCLNVNVSFLSSGMGAGANTYQCITRYLNVNGMNILGSPSMYNDLRASPVEMLTYTSTSLNSIIVQDVVAEAQSTALANVILVVFVAMLLGISMQLFASDSNRLVIIPLETMASFVRQLQQDPLHPMHLSNEAKRMLEDETKLVVDAMMKLSSMLQVGFGDAGASVIQRNMSSNSQKIDPVAPGKRIQGIYVFCDIRNFTDCTECLQTDVMVFVNRIAMFVHNAVVDNYGSPNKNIGDAFLLVWSLPEKKWSAHGSSNNDKTNIPYADHALEAVVRIIIETSHDLELQELTNRKAVQDRIPGYATKMGFGMHLGWGIEGAIGSILKIDATYLSPNVNMSSRLEGATKQYGALILMTDAVYDALTPSVQRLCRRIDRVTARGSSFPFDLYTYDAPRSGDIESVIKGSTIWDRFPPTTDDHFRDVFQEGVKYYITGDWEAAEDRLQTCLGMLPSDGPTKFLVDYISKHNNRAPATWNGYRKDGVD